MPLVKQRCCLRGVVKTQCDAISQMDPRGKEEALEGMQILLSPGQLTSVKLIFSPLNMRSRAASTPLDLACEEEILRLDPVHTGDHEPKPPSSGLDAAPSGPDRWLQPGALPHRLCRSPWAAAPILSQGAGAQSLKRRHRGTN